MNKSKILFLLIFSGFIAMMSCNKDDDDAAVQDWIAIL